MSEDDLIIARAFDSLMKKVIKGAARDGYRKDKKRIERVSLFTEVQDCEISKLSLYDKYFIDDSLFQVQGYSFSVDVPELASALRRVDIESMEIVLMYYFLKKKDREIAEILNIPKTTLSYRKLRALKMLRAILSRESVQ